MNKYFNDILQKEFKKDCPDHEYIPDVLGAVKRIIAIGDLHGDYNLTLDVLKLANVIKVDGDKVDWIGKDTHVVQVGDQIDRCRPYNYRCDHPLATTNDESSDIKILKLMTYLHKQAKKTGGMVISLLGNHEIMNSMGEMGYVSYLGLKQFEDYKDPKGKTKFKNGLEARKHAFAPGNEYGKFLGCTRVSSIIIGTNIFFHAGGLLPFLKKIEINYENMKKHDDSTVNRLKIAKLNEIVRKWLLKMVTPNNINKILTNHNSAFWTRLFGKIPKNVSIDDRNCQTYLEPVLKLLNVDTMIIGHTPQFSNNSGINKTCNNQLWRVDFGGSNAFNNFDEESDDDGNRSNTRKPQVLEILNDNEFNILKYDETKGGRMNIKTKDYSTQKVINNILNLFKH